VGGSGKRRGKFPTPLVFKKGGENEKRICTQTGETAAAGKSEFFPGLDEAGAAGWSRRGVTCWITEDYVQAGVRKGNGEQLECGEKSLEKGSREGMRGCVHLL